MEAKRQAKTMTYNCTIFKETPATDLLLKMLSNNMPKANVRIIDPRVYCKGMEKEKKGKEINKMIKKKNICFRLWNNYLPTKQRKIKLTKRKEKSPSLIAW